MSVSIHVGRNPQVRLRIHFGQFHGSRKGMVASSLPAGIFPISHNPTELLFLPKRIPSARC
jgi:hypothetical protein